MAGVEQVSSNPRFPDGVLADFDQLKRELGMTGEQLKCMPNAFDLMQPIPGAIEGVRVNRREAL